MASIASSKELEATSSLKSARTSVILNVDNKDDFTLCSLNLDKIEQQPLDLVLTEGESISFRIEGPHSIHLTGYYVNDEAEEDEFINDEDEDEMFSDEAEEDSQIEYDSDLEDEDYSDESETEGTKKASKNPRIRVIESDMEEDDEEESEFDSEDDEELDSEDDEELDSEEEEESESEEEEEKNQVNEKPSAKKVKFDLAAESSKKASESPKTNAAIKVTPPPAKVAASPVSTPVKAATPAAAQPAQKAQEVKTPTPVKKTLPSGLQIEDLKLGNGAKASQGKKVLIHYKGSLLNGSVFDSSFGGKPLKFAVGKNEVIKGMDIGIIGMAVGGSRKLTIPAPLGYGNQSIPKIPRNSTLVFEIRLEKIL